MIYDENIAAIEIDNGQKYTRQTRHIDITYFILLQWCDTYLNILSSISTSNNATDGLANHYQGFHSSDTERHYWNIYPI